MRELLLPLLLLPLLTPVLIAARKRPRRCSSESHNALGLAGLSSGVRCRFFDGAMAFSANIFWKNEGYAASESMRA